jgi:hypothetical protein
MAESSAPTPSGNIDYNRLGILAREAEQITRGITNLDRGGRISSMVIDLSPADPTMMAAFPSALIDTSYMPYPPTMTVAIRAMLVTRYGEVRTELADDFGMTLPEVMEADLGDH